MIVRKTRRLVVRMGQYESHEVIAEVTVDTNNESDQAMIEEAAGPGTLDGPVQFVDLALQELIASDVLEASFNTADEDSFIHEYAKNNTTKKK